MDAYVLFLNIYDFFETAVIKVLLTVTEAQRNVHMLGKWERVVLTHWELIKCFKDPLSENKT